MARNIMLRVGILIFVSLAFVNASFDSYSSHSIDGVPGSPALSLSQGSSTCATCATTTPSVVFSSRRPPTSRGPPLISGNRNIISPCSGPSSEVGATHESWNQAKRPADGSSNHDSPPTSKKSINRPSKATRDQIKAAISKMAQEPSQIALELEKDSFSEGSVTKNYKGKVLRSALKELQGERKKCGCAVQEPASSSTRELSDRDLLSSILSYLQGRSLGSFSYLQVEPKFTSSIYDAPEALCCGYASSTSAPAPASSIILLSTRPPTTTLSSFSTQPAGSDESIRGAGSGAPHKKMPENPYIPGQNLLREALVESVDHTAHYMKPADHSTSTTAIPVDHSTTLVEPAVDDVQFVRNIWRLAKHGPPPGLEHLGHVSNSPTVMA